MSSAGHTWKKKPDDDQEDDEEDRVDAMIKKTGCLEEHNNVQYCMFDHRDWRKCQVEVKKFRECIEKSKQRDNSL